MKLKQRIFVESGAIFANDANVTSGSNFQEKKDEYRTIGQMIYNEECFKAIKTVRIRVDLVNRVRAEIAAGTYYSDEKFEKALDRLFASFES